MNELEKQFEKETGIKIMYTQKQIDEAEKSQIYPVISLGKVKNKYTKWLKSKFKSQKEKIIEIIHNFCKGCPLHEIIIKKIEEL